MEPVEVPMDSLKQETLHRLIEEFICREGTDYGAEDFSLEQKVNQLLIQLKARKVRLVFDPETETCTILQK